MVQYMISSDSVILYLLYIHIYTLLLYSFAIYIHTPVCVYNYMYYIYTHYVECQDILHACMHACMVGQMDRCAYMCVCMHTYLFYV